MARCLLNMQAIEKELANYNFYELKKSASIGAGKSLTVKYAALRVQHAIEKQAFLGALLKGLSAARGAMGAAGGVMGALRGGAGAVGGALRGGAGAVGGALRSAAGAAPGIMRNAAGAVGDVAAGVGGAVRSGANTAGDALRTYGRNLSGSAVRNARQTSEMFPFSPSRPMPELASQIGKLEMARDSSRALTGAGLLGGGLTAGAAGAAMNKESGIADFPVRQAAKHIARRAARRPPAAAAAEALMDAKIPKPALLDDISSPPHRMPADAMPFHTAANWPVPGTTPRSVILADARRAERMSGVPPQRAPADAMPYNPAIHGADEAPMMAPMIENVVDGRRIPDMLSKAMKYLGIGGLSGAGAYGGYKALNSGGGADLVPDGLPDGLPAADLGKAAAFLAVYPTEKQAFLRALLQGGKLALQGGKYVAKGMGQLASTGAAAAAPHIRAGAQAAGAAGADMMKARPGLAAAGLVGAGAAGAAATIPAYNAAKGAVNSGINAVNNNVVSPIRDTMSRIHNSGVGMVEGYNKGLPQQPKYYSGNRQGHESNTYRAPDSDMYRQNY